MPVMQLLLCDIFHGFKLLSPCQDEPTSGLDARAAAIVMRAVRNIGDTGRTIVCTIHQPAIDIFEVLDLS